MKDKQQSYFVNIGSSSLLVIFLVLCLATFAILTLSSARSDYSFSERLAGHKKAYYEASAEAERVVDAVDRILWETAEEIDLSGQAFDQTSGQTSGQTNSPASQDTQDTVEEGSPVPEAYLEAAETALEGLQVNGICVETERTKEACIVSFRVPAGEQQELHVRLEVTDHRKCEAYYAVRMWEIVNVGSREVEQPLHLMPVIE